MTYVKATPENIDIGSVIKKGEEIFFVYKVNKTFVWAGKHDAGDVISMWKDKSIKEKWTDLMTRVKGKKLNYPGLEVEQATAKGTAEKNKATASVKTPKGKGGKRYLKACCEKKLDELFAASKKGKPYRYPVDCICGKVFHVVTCSPDGQLLVNHDYERFFFDVRTREYHYFRAVGGKEQKTSEVKGEEELKEAS